MTLNEWIAFGVKNHLIEDSDAIASAITLTQLYDEWIEWKSIHTESSAYIRRMNQQHCTIIPLIGIMMMKRNIELRPP